jgi:flagellar hook protein FlgE
MAFTEFDSRGDMHTFQMNYSYTAGAGGALGTWNCAVKDGATQQTLQTYTVNWNGLTSTYDFTPAPTALGTPISYQNATGATETVTLAVAGGALAAQYPDAIPIAGNFVDPANATVALAESPMTFSVPGANNMTVALDRSKLTQASDSTSSLTPEQDGYAMGTLSGYNFDSTGVMTGTFSNGQKKKLAQVALANFTNPGGLNKVSDTLYEKSNNSGEPSVGSTNTGGRGKLSPSSLEMSNVDLAQQFSDMIITQRGYQANSKIITTTDTMLEELVNLKR